MSKAIVKSPRTKKPQPKLSDLARAFAERTMDKSVGSLFELIEDRETEIGPMLHSAIAAYERALKVKITAPMDAIRDALADDMVGRFDNALELQLFASAEVGYQIALAALTKRHDNKTAWHRLASATLERVKGDKPIAAALLRISPELLDEYLAWPALFDPDALKAAYERERAQ